MIYGQLDRGSNTLKQKKISNKETKKTKRPKGKHLLSEVFNTIIT